MEEVLDAVIAQLEIMKVTLVADGGLSDEVTFDGDVWFGDPGPIPQDNYPFLYVAPVIDVPNSGTTRDSKRELTIRIGILIDPVGIYEQPDIAELPDSRRVVRIAEKIQRWFEKTSLRTPNGLVPNVTEDVVVGNTEYTSQLRGFIQSQGAEVNLTVPVRYPRRQ